MKNKTNANYNTGGVMSDLKKVVSIFDGISGGRAALHCAEIKPDRYVAFEIDKNAIKISKNNWKDIEHRGSALNVDWSEFKGFDLVIGGSPCQSLSIVQSQTREGLDGKSKLFFEFAKAVQVINPKYFLLENVASMTRECKQVITDIMGVEPVLMNGNCFVPQDRKRLIWTNIPFNKDLNECELCLNDILEDKVDEKYYYNYPLLNIDMNKQVCATMDFKNNDMHKRIFNPKFKVHTLTTCGGGNTQKKVLINGRARKLTPTEYLRLSGLPDNYGDGMADTHIYNGCGNGWVIPQFEHIFRGLK